MKKIIATILMVFSASMVLAEDLYLPEKINLNDQKYHQIEDGLLLDRTTVKIINHENQNGEPMEVITGTLSVVKRFPDGVYAIPSFRLSILASNCAIVYKKNVGDHNEKMLMSFLNGKPIDVYDVDFESEYDRKAYRLLCFLGNSK